MKPPRRIYGRTKNASHFHAVPSTSSGRTGDSIALWLGLRFFTTFCFNEKERRQKGETGNERERSQQKETQRKRERERDRKRFLVFIISGTRLVRERERERREELPLQLQFLSGHYWSVDGLSLLIESGRESEKRAGVKSPGICAHTSFGSGRRRQIRLQPSASGSSLKSSSSKSSRLKYPTHHLFPQTSASSRGGESWRIHI